MPTPRLRVDDVCKAEVASVIRELTACFNPYVMADRMRLTQPQFSELYRGLLIRFSLERLLLCVTRLSHDVNIVIAPAPPVGFRRPRYGQILIDDRSDPKWVT